MRKLVMVVLLVALALVGLKAYNPGGQQAMAASPFPRVRAVFAIGSTWYNMRPLTADWEEPQPYRMDVAPMVENGRTYLPVRFLAYSLGIPDQRIQWDPATQTVTLGYGIKLTIGSNQLQFWDDRVTMDVTPIMVNGRVMLPARWIAEGFGYYVNWDPAAQQITIVEPYSLKEMHDQAQRILKPGEPVIVVNNPPSAPAPQQPVPLPPPPGGRPTMPYQLMIEDEYPNSIPYTDIARRARGFMIINMQGEGLPGITYGAGVLVAEDLVLTAHHMVYGGQGRFYTDYTVQPNNMPNQVQRKATLVSYDPKYDLALLRLASPFPKMTVGEIPEPIAVPPIKTDPPAESQWIFAMGNPYIGPGDPDDPLSLAYLGIPPGQSIGSGVIGQVAWSSTHQVSTTATHGTRYSYDGAIATSAVTGYGNSGGPLYDWDGNLLGIASSIDYDYSYFVPIRFALPLIKAAQGAAN